MPLILYAPFPPIMPLTTDLTTISRKKVCIVPPDYTRFHSRAGMLTQLAYRHYGDAVTDVMPALGCHEPLTEEEREIMFEIVPAELFRVHDWRNDVVTVSHSGLPTPPSTWLVDTRGQTENKVSCSRFDMYPEKSYDCM